jgi:hypothetical protein
MLRPKASVYVLAAIVVAIAAMSACSSPNAQEENLVRQYFRASALRDNQTLANFAVVSFDPKTEGAVTDFDVTGVSAERPEPLRIVELSKSLAEAEAANKAFTEKKKAYQDANMDAIDRVLKAESAGRKLSGRDATVQAEWTKWRDETGAEAKKVSAARTSLQNARPVAELSLSSPNGDPPAIEQMEGNLVSKDISVAATVRGPDGTTSQKNYVVTASRAVVKGPNGDRNGKWVITAVKPA